jgi:hypothetical protein
MRSLDLSGSRVKDIRPLSSLIDLEELDLTSTFVPDGQKRKLRLPFARKDSGALFPDGMPSSGLR